MGKAKGSAFERLTCEKLSLWVSNFTRKDIFWRSAGSGGRFTAALKSRASNAQTMGGHGGDIVATDELGAPFMERFVIECKHWKKIDFDGLLYSKGSCAILFEWVKTSKQALTRGVHPLMVIRENGKGMLLLTNHVAYESLVKGLLPNRSLEIKAIYPQHGILICAFDDWMLNISHAILLETWKGK